jgi:hypothetical protein
MQFWRGSKWLVYKNIEVMLARKHSTRKNNMGYGVKLAFFSYMPVREPKNKRTSNACNTAGGVCVPSSKSEKGLFVRFSSYNFSSHFWYSLAEEEVGIVFSSLNSLVSVCPCPVSQKCILFTNIYLWKHIVIVSPSWSKYPLRPTLNSYDETGKNNFELRSRTCI